MSSKNHNDINAEITNFECFQLENDKSIYRVPPKRRPFFPVRTQVLTCPKMAVRKGREPRVRYWSRVYLKRTSKYTPNDSTSSGSGFEP